MPCGTQTYVTRLVRLVGEWGLLDFRLVICLQQHLKQMTTGISFDSLLIRHVSHLLAENLLNIDNYYFHEKVKQSCPVSLAFQTTPSEPEKTA
jgi:hypothetical protein